MESSNNDDDIYLIKTFTASTNLKAFGDGSRKALSLVICDDSSLYKILDKMVWTWSPGPKARFRV